MSPHGAKAASVEAKPKGQMDAGMVVDAARKIDSLLEKGWDAHGIKPNPEASDEVFLRRIYLDVVGRIPTYREAADFYADQDPGKRGKLIDQLLNSEGYNQHFFNYWADILRLQSDGRQAGRVTGAAYANYLKESLRSNKPYDQMVRELISAQGYAWDNGAIGYYMRDRGMPLDNMANTVRIFLGTRIECAQCHNHPFDKWTQMEFYQMAAFTYPVETNDYSGGPLGETRNLMAQKDSDRLEPLRLQGRRDPVARRKFEEQRQMLRSQNREITQTLNELVNTLRYTAVGWRDRKQLTLPHDYQYDDAKPRSRVSPMTMMGEKMAPQPGQDGLELLAQWMTSKDNPRFTTVIANRLWKKVFGLGLIEPVDELMDTTQASNPELMTHLEGLMKDLNYDMKAYLRVLLNTKAYQREVTREEVIAGVPYHFPGPVLRRMSAEQIWDSFVTLINPTPDMVNEELRKRSERSIEGVEFVFNSLQALGPEEILKGAEKAREVYRKHADQIRELQGKLNLARKAKDTKKMEELGRELRRLNLKTRSAVRENVMAPAATKYVAMHKGAVQKGSGGEQGGMMSDTMMMMMEDSEDGKLSSIPGFDRSGERRAERNRLSEEQRNLIREEAEYFGVTNEKEFRNYSRVRIQNMRTWLRSAEIESPAPRGHYLREFGQSDRETIENANYDASVSQALVFMNSQLLPQVMNKYSALMLSVAKQPYPEDQVNVVYMTLLSRQPTKAEREIWRNAADKGLTDIEDLIYALINTQQFIFIQ